MFLNKMLCALCTEAEKAAENTGVDIKFTLENLPTAVKYTGIGMAGIFAVTCVIIFSVWALNRLMSKK